MRDETHSEFSLSKLMAPVQLEIFETEHWGKKPLLVQRDDPEYYTNLLTLDDVDRLLTLSGPTFDNIRLVLNGNGTPIGQLIQRGANGVVNALEAIYDRYRSGTTVVLKDVNDRWEPLQRFTHALGAEVNAGFAVNVYLTPGGNAQGFTPHYDPHDVFIAQVYGSKNWRLYGPAFPPRPQDRSHHKFGPGIDASAKPEQEILLKSGDLLYLPRGCIHAASSNDTASVHLTIGVHPVQWSSIILEELHRLYEDDVRFRSGLPIGFASKPEMRIQAEDTVRDLLAVIHEKLSAERIIERAVATAMSVNSPVLRGHLTDLEQMPELGLHTTLSRRAGVICHVSTSDSTVRVDFHNKTVEFPIQLVNAVRYLVCNQTQFTAANIPGELDANDRILLVRTFLREGLLTFCL